MNLTVAMRKVDGQYEGALIIDQKFTRSTSSKSANDLVSRLLGPILSAEQEDGAEIALNVAILTVAEVRRVEDRQNQARETEEALAEAKSLEARNAAMKREEAARIPTISNLGEND
jgi:hypothetical protein